MASTIRRGLGPKPGQKKVTFQCKDAVIVKYCDMKFGAEFTGWANKVESIGGANIALRKMHQRLAAEAKEQEWYDFILTTEPPYREVIRDDLGAPVLLVPRAVVVDA